MSGVLFFVKTRRSLGLSHYLTWKFSVFTPFFLYLANVFHSMYVKKKFYISSYQLDINNDLGPVIKKSLFNLVTLTVFNNSLGPNWVILSSSCNPRM